MTRPVSKSPSFAVALLAFVLLVSVVARLSAVGPALPLLQASEIEPNDTPAEAVASGNVISLNQTRLGEIVPVPPNTDIDIDVFVFTAELNRAYRVELGERASAGDFLLRLTLLNSSGQEMDFEDTVGGFAEISWNSGVDTTFYFRVEERGDSGNLPKYDLTVKSLVTTPVPTDTPEPTEWDSCEVNDTLTGTWSGTASNGPCPISVGPLVSDLNFVPFKGLVPDVDYFLVSFKAGRSYRIETKGLTVGVDTEIYLYAPGETDDSQFVGSNDDAPGLGLGSRIEWNPNRDGSFVIKVENREPLPHESDETYNLQVTDDTPAPTPSHTPGGPTATPTGVSIPGKPDAFEPNWEFKVASLIGLGVKYTSLNFVPYSGTGTDNEFYKLWVTGGKLYTCETLDLGDATNTNMILYSCPSYDCGFAGNDDIQPFDPNDPYRSKITFFSSYTGYLYVLLGQVGVEQILPGEWANLSYSLQCFIELPGTATPTPTSAFVPAPPQPTSTPAPGTPVPLPPPTRVVIIIVPMTTPQPPAPPPPLVTPTPQLYVINVVVYYDRNGNGLVDPGEGIRDVLTRAHDAITDDLLSIDYTDEIGRIQFTIPSRRPVRVSVPFFGFEQIVTTTDANLQIRISPVR
jgi:hypothetical protein